MTKPLQVFATESLDLSVDITGHPLNATDYSWCNTDALRIGCPALSTVICNPVDWMRDEAKVIASLAAEHLEQERDRLLQKQSQLERERDRLQLEQQQRQQQQKPEHTSEQGNRAIGQSYQALPPGTTTTRPDPLKRRVSLY